jgi:tetratricopeptide (TPR) repeat protein
MVGNVTKGMEHLETAFKLSPNNPERMCDLATAIYHYTRDEKKATELLERAISLDPNNVSFYVTLADIKLSYMIHTYQKNKKKKETILREQRREVVCVRTCVCVDVRIGLISASKLDDALLHLNEAKRINDKDYIVYHYLGLLFFLEFLINALKTHTYPYTHLIH